MTSFILSLFAVGAAGLGTLSWLSHREPSGGEPAIPRFADLAALVMAYQVGRVPVGRIAVLGFWWWVGWHFFAR
jgi:hypothetical protein